MPRKPAKKNPDISTDLTVSDLILDPDNANQGTDRGGELLESVIRRRGFLRSISIDKDNKILAGNQVTAAAIRAGLVRVRVVETDGKEVIALKRVDVTLDSPEGRELAIADNAIALRSINLDGETLVRQAKEHDLELESIGITADELKSLMATAEEEPGDLKKLDTQAPPKMAWVLIGIPTVRFGEISAAVESLASVAGTVVETTVNDGQDG